MVKASIIKKVSARQIFTRQEFSGLGHPAVETRVETKDGSVGVAVASGGFSVGKHEAQFIYDGGVSWSGKGVSRAVDNVNSIIGPRIKGMNATMQGEVDETLIDLDGTENKAQLGSNAIASTSAAVLKAAAASLGLPLYQHIGGVNACVLPVPGTICIDGSERYGSGERGGGKPSYAITCYGFGSFKEASYACWEIQREIARVLENRFGAAPKISGCYRVVSGHVDHDQELWEIMAGVIDNLGYEDRVGIQVDVAAATFYDSSKESYVGLFSRDEKSREDMIDLYMEMVDSYPFVILEDPLDEDDFDGHRILTEETGIEIVGDDLFVTNIERLKKGIDVGACNATLIKVPQIGTFSEALDMVRLALREGYGVMPCSSRGEGPDIADYTVGLNTGQIREGGLGPIANRLSAIEDELGSRARFPGKSTLKLK